ncbi:hypothetical protein [Pseudovibrio sp. Tun.PSC04-5.I4]|uniref:hypothetical protein n=1 Tax=Pseudovibrio sp. Tun.PSC04-5.I4 TaxID=1798213 RepID=UPI0008811A7C|nr:hypothetical protein [Pseudovibrio sp. Tun.PSC04-5.I4]SDR49278.1 hypothetical protein SAMN04515695_6161 [Pseudovibrio sp. Tun.PSC04-5.I4]
MGYQPRLKWHLSWRDKPDDGTAKDPNRPDVYLRTYKELAPKGGEQWYWVAADMKLIEQGLAPTKEEAQRQAEDAYFSYLAKMDTEKEGKVKVLKETTVPSGVRLEGRYPEHLTEEQVKEQLVGPFGGRLEAFGDGCFVYMAYND